MNKLTIIQGSNGVCQSIMKHTEASAKQFGYDYVVYDVDRELGYGIPFELPKVSYELRNMWKPLCMGLARKNIRGNIVWVDADAILAKPIDDIFDGEWDVGITFKAKNKWPGYEQCQIKLNSGVVAIKDNDKAKEFLNLWWENTKNRNLGGSDQRALNRLLDIRRNYFEEHIGMIREWNNIKIKYLPFHFNWCAKTDSEVKNPCKDWRIMHFFRSEGSGRWEAYKKIHLPKEK